MSKPYKLEVNIGSSLFKAIVQEYKRFLLLLALKKPQVELAPPLLVHLLWQYHVAESRDYSKFCMSVFRTECLDTIPLRHRERDADAYTTTRALYIELF